MYGPLGWDVYPFKFYFIFFLSHTLSKGCGCCCSFKSVFLLPHCLSVVNAVAATSHRWDHTSGTVVAEYQIIFHHLSIVFCITQAFVCHTCHHKTVLNKKHIYLMMRLQGNLWDQNVVAVYHWRIICNSSKHLPLHMLVRITVLN